VSDRFATLKDRLRDAVANNPDFKIHIDNDYEFQLIYYPDADVRQGPMNFSVTTNFDITHGTITIPAVLQFSGYDPPKDAALLLRIIADELDSSPPPAAGIDREALLMWLNGLLCDEYSNDDYADGYYGAIKDVIGYLSPAPGDGDEG